MYTRTQLLLSRIYPTRFMGRPGKKEPEFGRVRPIYLSAAPFDDVEPDLSIYSCRRLADNRPLTRLPAQAEG